MKEPLIIDLFAGGGGASVGIEMALGRCVDIAVNHDEMAIKMHETNHPDTLHLTEDIFAVDLKEHVGGKKVALMWASPDCFPAGNLVLTDKGYKPIEEMECFDNVLTHTGEYRMVTRVIKKSDRKFTNIKISGTEDFQATLNHPFYARKKYVKTIHGEHRSSKVMMRAPEWVNAENLTTEYRVGIPVNSMSIIPVWNGCTIDKYNQYGRTVSEVHNELGKYMGNACFWWIVGRYMGDGYLSESKGMVDICCNFDEQEDIRLHLDALSIRFTERDKVTTHSFMISSKEWVEFLKQFGVGSAEKSITPMIMNLPVHLLKSFADGYLSADGCEEVIGNNVRVTFTTISKKLAYGMQHVLLKAYGRYAGMTFSERQNNIIEGRKVNVHPTYNLVFYKNDTNRLQYEIEDGIAWVNVKKVEIVNDVQKSVYTLSVDTDESYTVNNIAVHNCTSHSKAKGGQPRNRGLRVLPWAVYKHAKAIRPSVIIMENVEEIQDWGPLNEHGRPIPEKRGEDYRRFINALIRLGYDFQCRELVAADYGAPTTRKRWYAIFRNDGQRIKWPVPTHSKFPEITGLKPWKPCGDYIDWSDLGKSIFDRKKPLAEKTQRRIANGIKKFIIDNPNPYIVDDDRAAAFLIQYHSETKNEAVRGQNLSEPIQTIDTSNRYGLVTAFITKYYKTGIGQGLGEPLHTITTSPGHFGLVSAFLIKYYGAERDGQTMTSPLGTVVTKDRFGLASIVLDIKGDKYVIYDIFLRMLQPEELKLMQGFPADYIIDHDAEWKPYPKVEQVARIGNSVVPIMAQKLVAANCGYMRVGKRHPNPRYENEDDGQIKFIV